jgi:hypothetical protein
MHPPILRSTWIDDNPLENLVKFEYKPNMKIKNFEF